MCWLADIMATIMTKLLRLSTMSGKQFFLLLLVVGVCLHDPLSFVEAVRPDLFKYKKGVF
uniref:Uncharacterized protein n=1 Tax=Brassica oleracea TaxID=3712 RepID=A0A3P6CUB5_BRAOL|nr:unnamed protein product [Brassica oleracea]VDD14065.1 unnamed protein product [Brassica oleracea]